MENKKHNLFAKEPDDGAQTPLIFNKPGDKSVVKTGNSRASVVLPFVSVATYDENEATTCVEVAILLREDKLK